MGAIAPLIIQAAIQYGPQVVIAVTQALQKPDVTIAEIEAIFAGVHPYAYYFPTNPPAKAA